MASPSTKMRPIQAAPARAQLVQLAAGHTPGPSADLLFGDWYPACRASTLRPGHAHPVLLLGLPLLVGRRNDQTPFALRDLCPHRGIPLSAGWFDGDTVMCKYHGWRFDPCSGRCEAIPSLTSHDTLDPHKIHAGAFPTAERDGHLWVYLPPPNSGRLNIPTDLSFRPERRSRGVEKPAVPGQSPDVGAKSAPLPPIPETPKFSPKFRTAHLSADLPCNVDHGIIGLMDPAHGPFVHQAWWWRSAASIHEKTKHFEPITDYYAEGSEHYADRPHDGAEPTDINHLSFRPEAQSAAVEKPASAPAHSTDQPTATENLSFRPEAQSAAVEKPASAPAHSTDQPTATENLSFRPERSEAEKPASAPAHSTGQPTPNENLSFRPERSEAEKPASAPAHSTGSPTATENLSFRPERSEAEKPASAPAHSTDQPTATENLSFRPERSEVEKPASAPAHSTGSPTHPPATGFRMASHTPSSNSLPYKLLGITGDKVTTTIDFVMPNRRYETIRAGDKWFSSLTTVTPITPSTCRIDVVAAWNLWYSVPFVTSILKFFGARFVRQDQETMIEQAQGLRFGPALMLIDDADKPAKWYFALKQARLKAQQDPTAPPTPHPLPGPTTLHWRS